MDDVKNIVLVHGIAGYKKESYFPWLKAECEGLGLRVVTPKMPGFRFRMSYERWRRIFEKTLSRAGVRLDAQTIILGQSLGTQFCVKYMVAAASNPAAYISCAGFRRHELRDVARNRVLARPFARAVRTFVVTEGEFTSFKGLPFPKFSFYSENDNYFEQPNLEDYAAAIGAEKFFVPGKGHFNRTAGVLGFTEVLALIKKLVNQVPQ
jgi:predicted alpha/beta hydrolase family esterase